MHDDELIEVYIPKNDRTKHFFDLSTEDKENVVSLGLLAKKCAINAVKDIADARWLGRIKEMEAEKEELARCHREAEGRQTEKEKLMRESLEDATALAVASAMKQGQNMEREQTKYLEERVVALRAQLEKVTLATEQVVERRVRAETALLRERIQDLKQCLETEAERSRKTQCIAEKSTEKGKHGEMFVLGELNKLFPSAEVEDTHAEPHRGDFIVNHEGLTMMVESKNYKRNVQKAEIDKFYRDVDSQENTDYDCALLLSLNSGICNREDFSFEVRNDIPIMYIHNAAANFYAVGLAFRFFKAVCGATQLDFSAKETADKIRHLATAFKKLAVKQKAALDKNYALQLDYINSQQELLTSLFGTVKVAF